MATLTTPSSAPAQGRQFDNGAEFLRSLGDIPMSRIIWNPIPGTATEQDLLYLIEGDNKRLCELVDGTLVEKPIGYEESLIALAIAFAIKTFAEPQKLGIVSGPDATLRMLAGNIRVPDVSFVSAADLPGGKRPKVKVPKLPPTLAVEVISQGNTTAEMQKKTREYYESGAKIVWLVYPKTKTVAVFDGNEKPSRIVSGDQSLDGGSVLPGFSMPLAAVFKVSDFE